MVEVTKTTIVEEIRKEGEYTITARREKENGAVVRYTNGQITKGNTYIGSFYVDGENMSMNINDKEDIMVAMEINEIINEE